MLKKNKGITLIALIITIIILLILVAVSIDLIVDGKLFDSAGDAVSKTNEKVGQQQNRVDELMGELDYVESKQDGHDWQYTDNTLAQLKCTCGVCKRKNATGVIYSIGQQVKRTTSDTLLEEGQTPTGTEWVVFGAEDCDKNGTNETLLITTLAPSRETLSLEGADAYVNGIAKIEAKVKEIYGNKAKAMTIDDVNRTLGYTPAGGMYYGGGDNTTGNFTTKLKELSTWESIKANGTNTPDGANTEEALGEYVLDGYYYVMNSESASSGELYVSSIISNVARNLVFGTSNENNYRYWLASRGVYVDLGTVDFGPGAVDWGYAKSNSGDGLFTQAGYSDVVESPVRAVVPLRSEIPEGGEILVSSESWNLR